ncbi:MAG: hypothetical protein E7677_04850 [Ruminococcaceae bacterium]|nr:hypothetical protein [Oscillospiraceae bacterium]
MGDRNMKHKYKFAILGGDMRQYAVARSICANENISICVSALCRECTDDTEIRECDDVREALKDADAVVLPLPVSTDGVTLNCPGYLENQRITLDSIIEAMEEKSILFGGRIPPSTTVKAQAKGVKVYDYFLCEPLQIKNAYITAEAAISIAMNSLDKCLRGATVAVTGTGRISRLLCELLLKLGSRVTVAGRNADALAYFEIMGCKTLLIDGESGWSGELEHGYDIIFNTVPSWIFDRKFLERADKALTVIELASAPGGVDICAARELGTNVLWASSLPGKYAPHTAGILIGECVCQAFEKMEVRK